MARRLFILVATLSLSPLLSTQAVAGIDLQADMNRIVAAIQRFDANSASTSSVTTITGIKTVFSTNASILREIRDANAAFKRDLNAAKRMIPSKDTKNSPAFSTLMNLAKGYEEWLKYQNINQAAAVNCINKAGSSFNSFASCSIAILPKTLENERVGKQKLQNAWNAWRQWQVKFGYA